MEILLACLERNDLPVPDAPWLWLGAGLLLLGLALAGVYGLFALAPRGRDRLEGHLLWLDGLLSRRAPRPWNFVKSRFDRNSLFGLELTVFACLIVGLAVLFAEITEGWLDQEELYRVDQATHCALEGFLGEGGLAAFRFLTHFADVLTLVILGSVLFVVLLSRRLWWQALALLLALAPGQALLWGMKWVFARPRPEQQLADAVGQSFPSGHSFSAMVFYGFLAFLAWRFIASKALRALAIMLLGLLILAIGASRLLLSVHWVSDVLGGFVIGLAWLIASLLLARAWFAWKGPL